MLSFEELGLGPNLLQALEQSGYTNPTPIQEKTIPAILKSENDLMALAQTGTGKTAAFSLPIIEQIDPNSRQLQALILCPTRELCIQITKSLEKYSQFAGKISVAGVYGGANIQTQVRQLHKGCHIVAGTPGRTLDLIKRGDLDISNIKWLVLDEADEMLNMGFKEDLDSILSNSPSQKQTLLFSATMSSEIQNISKKYMKNPDKIEVGKRNNAAENVEHHFYAVNAKDRYNCLKRIADFYPDVYGIVFCRTRQETKEVADKLIADGYNADSLHGDLTQQQREHVMNKFRIKNLQILVATDVAARGLDITGLSHVINYNLPDDSEVYIHRCGRTGRAGKSGISVIIVHSRETKRIHDLERVAGRKFTQMQVPTGKEICEKQLYYLVDKITNSEVDENQISPYLGYINEKLGGLEKDELLKRFISLEFNTFLDFYKDAEDLNISIRGGRDDYDRRDRNSRDRDSGRRGDRPERGDRGERGERSFRGGDGGNFTKLYIGLGSKDRFNPVKLIEMINRSRKVKNAQIGKIDIMTKFTLFEIESSFADDVIKELSRGFDGSGEVEVKRDEYQGGSSSRSGGSRDGGRDSNRGSSRGDYDSDKRKSFKPKANLRKRRF